MLTTCTHYLALTIAPITVALALTACSGEVVVANQAPEAALDSIAGTGGIIEVWYGLADAEGDDVAVSISYCRADDCLPATEAAGSDGTANLPTQPGEWQLKLFRWLAPCDLELSAFDAQVTIRITPSDGDVGAMVESESFTLDDMLDDAFEATEDCDL